MDSIQQLREDNSRLREQNERLRKAVEELSMLNELARVISSTMDPDKVIQNIVKSSLKAVDAQQGMITVVDEAAPTEMKTRIRQKDSTSHHQSFHLNQNILGWMMKHRMSLLVNDISSDERFPGIHTDGNQKSILCAPLLVRNQLIGILAVFNKREGNGFKEEDKRLLSIIAAQSAQILENARLAEQERSLISIREQIQLASQIQIGLLPKEVPRIPGYDMAGRSLPAQTVGGDYFDFIPIDEHHLAICLGDVSGKGLPASLLMATTQATIRGQSVLTNSPKECIGRSNNLLFEATADDRFVTLFYGILNIHEHRFSFCNAGHDNPYLISGSSAARRLSTGGVVLSILKSFPYSEDMTTLEPGDMLVIYSDGITEAMNQDAELFTDDRLGELLTQCKTLPAGEVINKVFAAVKAHAGSFSQSDDMTMVVLRRTT